MSPVGTGVRVILGLGSNLGERWAHLARCLAQLLERDPELVTSSVYETEPVGGPAGQGPYLNCVVSLRFDGSPIQMLEIAHALEADAGRIRRERHGERTLDVDVLFFGELRSDDPELVLPHPRALERAFVLAPLEELAPDLAGPDWQSRLGGAEALAAAVRRVGAILIGVPAEPATEPG